MKNYNHNYPIFFTNFKSKLMIFPKPNSFQSNNSASFLVEFAQLKLLEYLCGREDAAVNDPGDGEGAAHYGANCCHEVVEGRTVLVVSYCDRVQVIPAGRGEVREVGKLDP